MYLNVIKALESTLSFWSPWSLIFRPKHPIESHHFFRPMFVCVAKPARDFHTFRWFRAIGRHPENIPPVFMRFCISQVYQANSGKKTWWKLHETRRFTTFWWSVIPWCVVCFPYLKSPRWPRGKTPPRYAMARGQAIQAREYACPGLRPGVESWSWKRERGRSDPKNGSGNVGWNPWMSRWKLGCKRLVYQ